MSDATRVRKVPPPPEAGRASVEGRRVLVVDASRLQRRLLGAQLEGWGYRVDTAGDMDEALACLDGGTVRIVISDLDLPGGGGFELCRALRGREGGYVWFVLLTASDAPGLRISGLQAGADDFLAKPVAASELRARIAAGERVLDMERRLADEHARLAEALAERDRLAALVERDLREGRRLQRSLMPKPEARYGPAALSVALRPSGQVGGDLVGHFATGRGRVGFYGIDVSGHGIASALMTARLKGYLSDQGGENIAVMRVDETTSFGYPPAMIAARLNELSLREMSTDHYFTMFYGELDTATGWVRYVQAGHPPPLVLRADGAVEAVEGGGLPLGLMEGADWEEGRAHLNPGDRLLIHSDGFAECEGPKGMLGEAGFAALARRHAGRRGRHFLNGLIAGALDWAGPAGADDDISALLVELDEG